MQTSKVRQWVKMMNSKKPPDRQNPRVKMKTMEWRKSPEVRAALVMRNQIKQTIVTNLKVAEELCELKFRIFILNHFISEQIEIGETKMATNKTIDISTGSSSGTEGTDLNVAASATPGRKQSRLRCKAEGCNFECTWRTKMEKHLEEEHGITEVNNDTVNTVIFEAGLSPSKHSTQTPGTSGNPAVKPKKDPKRQRSSNEETEPEALRRKVDDSEPGAASSNNKKEEPRFLSTQDEGIGEITMSRTADEVELDLLAKIQAKGEAEKEEALLKEQEDEDDVFGDDDEFLEGAVGGGDRCTWTGSQDTTAQTVTEDQFTTVLNSPNNSTRLEDMENKENEENKNLLAEARSDKLELENQVSQLNVLNEKLREKEEEDKKKISDLQALLNAKLQEVKEAKAEKSEVEKMLRKAEVFNEKWRKVGKDYLDGSKANKNEAAEVKKRCDSLSKKVDTLTIQRDRALENAENQKSLYDKTQEALVKERADHSKTMRRIPCSKKDKCENQKTCPYGHQKKEEKEKKKFDEPCNFWNPATRSGCQRGAKCRFRHDNAPPPPSGAASLAAQAAAPAPPQLAPHHIPAPQNMRPTRLASTVAQGNPRPAPQQRPASISGQGGFHQRREEPQRFQNQFRENEIPVLPTLQPRVQQEVHQSQTQDFKSVRPKLDPANDKRVTGWSHSYSAHSAHNTFTPRPVVGTEDGWEPHFQPLQQLPDPVPTLANNNSVNDIFANSAMDVDENNDLRECEQFQRRYLETRNGGQLLNPVSSTASRQGQSPGRPLTPTEQVQQMMVRNAMKMERRSVSTPAASPSQQPPSPAVSPVHMSTVQPPMVGVPAQDLLGVLPNRQQGLHNPGFQPPEGVVMVNPLSNEYHALMDHYQAQQRNAPSPQPQVAQQPQPQPQMVQQTLTQMMRTSQPSQQENQNLLNNMATINSIQGIAQRVRDQQQSQEQKFSSTPEFQFKF